jgi:hypothetical protein
MSDTLFSKRQLIHTSLYESQLTSKFTGQSQIRHLSRLYVRSRLVHLTSSSMMTQVYPFSNPLPHHPASTGLPPGVGGPRPSLSYLGTLPDTGPRQLTLPAPPRATYRLAWQASACGPGRKARRQRTMVVERSIETRSRTVDEVWLLLSKSDGLILRPREDGISGRAGMR